MENFAGILRSFEVHQSLKRTFLGSVLGDVVNLIHRRRGPLHGLAELVFELRS